MKIDGIEFKPVDLSITNNTNDSVPRIRISKSINFNSAFCKAVGYAPHIDLYANLEKERIAFIGRSKPTMTSRRFAKSQNESERRNKYVSLSAKRFVQFIKNISGIDTGSLTGAEKDGYVIFDLTKGLKK
ncbi:MAG: hypothetical protein ABF624_00025 [Liquorilactobacillus ghanensis]|uniref:hypothetical protein n=1 Tax=Liquorilactobacillus ghanensis TaxID=399370 RepID=UPI0039ED109F